MQESVPAVTPPRPHVLACKNFMLGTCNLLIIGLPADWRLQTGPFPTEVDRWVLQGDYSWATSGRGSYRFLKPGRPRWHTLEAFLRTEPLRAGAAAELTEPAAALGQVEEEGEQNGCGHPTRWAIGAVRRGLFRRWQPALAVSLACSVTRRQVRLLVEGPEQAVLAECRDALLGTLECH